MGPDRRQRGHRRGLRAIHLPLAFDGVLRRRRHIGLGIATLVGAGIGLRLLIARMHVCSGRSLLTIGLLHASFNATSEFINPAYGWIRLGMTVLLGIIAISITHPIRPPRRPEAHRPPDVR